MLYKEGNVWEMVDTVQKTEGSGIFKEVARVLEGGDINWAGINNN